MILYGVVRLVGLLLHGLPLTAGYFIADRIADTTFVFWRRGRANMIDNMAHVLGAGAPRAAAADLARRALRNYLRYLVDFLRSPWLTTEELQRRMEFNRWEPFDQARADEKGTIFVGMHMGNWDFGAALIALRGYHINVVADSFSNRRLNEFVLGNRRRLGLSPIPREQAARRVLAVLRRNEGIAILMDRPVPAAEGVTIDFFGSPTAVPAGAAALALKTGARIVPAGMIRTEGHRFRGIAGDCIEYLPTGDQQTDVRLLTQHLMDVLGGWVREYPDQWFMFRRMWPEPLPSSRRPGT
ncbi:MAG: lysophospholipid acyltransferase family protein [Chloroflexota bacterium]